MTEIEVFADVGCPFAHMGLSMLVAERDERNRSDVTLRVRAWPLEIVNGSGFDAEVVAGKAEALRTQLGTGRFHDFDGSAYASTFIPAMELTAVAYEADPGTGEAVALEVRDLTFEQGVDVADPAVLADLAKRHGIELPDRAERSRVEADLAEGRDRNVIGSPHFFIAGVDAFCPALDIHSGDAGLQVSVARDGLESLLQTAFG
jgi:predicted DsbA family dithiol-disulfide isomerase